MDGEIPNLPDHSVQVGDSIFNRVNNLVNTIWRWGTAIVRALRYPKMKVRAALDADLKRIKSLSIDAFFKLFELRHF